MVQQESGREWEEGHAYRSCAPGVAGRKRGVRVCWSFLLAGRADGMAVIRLPCSPKAHTRYGWISLVSPCARETRTRDQSDFQYGGARTRAHVRTDPGCSL